MTHNEQTIQELQAQLHDLKERIARVQMRAKPRRLTGARPSARHRLAAAMPHVAVGDTAPYILRKPAKLSMWLNDVYGDCVTAEEAFSKAAHTPEIFIPDSEVLSWATNHGVLNGAAELTTVLDAMVVSGFAAGTTSYTDGPATSVDWTNMALLHNAITHGPVKVGVASAQLQNAAPESDPLPNGWFCTGFTPDADEDHCGSLCGYGTLTWLAEQLEVSVPSGIDGSATGYGLFTWGSIAIIDAPSMLAIVGEAWLRNPTTIVK